MEAYDVGTQGLKLRREGPVLWCVIDRPQARNALTPAMYFGLKRAVRLVNSFKEPCALIITGSGDSFSAGGDLGGRQEAGDEPVPPGITHESLPFLAIRESMQPVIAAVNGICMGGGLLIAMMADIAVVSDQASFRVPELLRGIIDASYAAMLPAHIGMARARDLILSCRRIGASEAYEMGLFSRMVPHQELEAEALRAACEILRTAPEARAHTKRMLNQQYPPIDYETMFASLAFGREPREGMRAFMEKRDPDWTPQDLPA
jgi:enoyl-CoA hydratase/carnithine racemase